MKILRITCILVGLCLGIWTIIGWGERSFKEFMAREKYLFSRPGAPNSRAFVTMGITNGMSVRDVDEILVNAYMNTGLMRTYGNVHEHENAVFYMFSYGPEWKPLFVGKKKHLCEELIKVSFDDLDRAIRVDRIYVTGLLINAKSV